MLIRKVRRVAVGRPVPADEPPLDLRLARGRVVEIGVDLARAGEDELAGEGRWVIPGLWDQHVHFGQWAATADRLDLTGTDTPEEAVDRVGAGLAGRPGEELVVGFGYRSASWFRPPTVAELDRATGRRPVVLISGDAHNGWLNSAALRLLGVPAAQGLLTENEWFEVLPRLDQLPGAAARRDQALRAAVEAAHARGVVGIVDFEWEPTFRAWPERVGAGLDTLRVRCGVYPEHLEEALRLGLRTGEALPGTGGLVELGSLKIISDGSLGTRTAFCCTPYAGGDDRGVVNLTRDDLRELLARATRHGLSAAVHAIGDAAASIALDVFAETGARGSLEHAQLITWADIERMARLGVVASVQPAHLLDDRDLIERYWPDRADRCFPWAAMLRAGVRLAFGSDAPVAPLDPWRAITAAVRRTSGELPEWQPAQAISAADALASSTDGQTTVRVGSRADLVLLDENPLGPAGLPADASVAATVVGGRVVWPGSRPD